MRINSNAMFFGRANLGMKKATNSVAVETLLFATDTDFQIWQYTYDITVRDQICETRIYAARTPELDRRCTGELPTTVA